MVVGLLQSIHPFYDGNGRNGRVLNVLYLVKEGLLDGQVFYLSRSIVRSKADYDRLLQAVRDQDAWEEWGLYLLAAVEQTAGQKAGRNNYYINLAFNEILSGNT